MTTVLITHCPHGLDMRLNPRCYLCTPLPPTSAGSTCWCPMHSQLSNDVPQKPLARCEMRAMAAYAASGDLHRAADNLGLSFYTVRNQLYVARGKLGVTSSIDAFRALGWLVIPAEELT